MLPYINIHSHHPIYNELSIQNIDLPDYSTQKTQHLFSLGLHPWSIESYEFSEIKKTLNTNLLKNEKFLIAIGETGIDKNINTPVSVQEEIFRMHVTLALELKKPLIIHCVRSFNEIQKILREMRFSFPVIIHGFNNNLQIAESCINSGYYLSFGAALLKEESNARKALKEIPNDRFFLETDDKEISIQQVYEKAASIKNISMDELLKHQNHNFELVFKNISV